MRSPVPCPFLLAVLLLAPSLITAGEPRSNPDEAAIRKNLDAYIAAARANTRAAFAAPHALKPIPARNAYLAHRTAQATAVRTAVRPRTSALFSPSWWVARRPLWTTHSSPGPTTTGPPKA